MQIDAFRGCDKTLYFSVYDGIPGRYVSLNNRFLPYYDRAFFAFDNPFGMAINYHLPFKYKGSF
jgi:hypothetical protein